ncbi:DUF6261 family protein [Ancylomarina sp. DW003]|nr:DUF6261 family protein [Ancylomarina sp. DW003]MDE5421680.1 DUF6261 family protein [Ancylomarina sp. DW003]
MGEQIVNKCKAKEVQNIAQNILMEIKKKDWSSDTFITILSQRIEEENEILTQTIGQLGRGEFTEELAAKDAIFDRDFICLEQFVEANLYMRDKEVAANAKEVWKVFAVNDPKLYIQSYESQILSFNSLIKELDSEAIKPLLKSLVGVSDCLDLVKSSAKELAETYQKMKQVSDEQMELIAPMAQQKLLREIINNDLLPYLCVMANVNKDVYGGIKHAVDGYIEDLNFKVRTRTSCTSN